MSWVYISNYILVSRDTAEIEDLVATLCFIGINSPLQLAIIHKDSF